jgi:ATP/maltotriose-dependent transcriptional regulator MalT
VTAPETAHPFVGRQAELSALRAELAAARAGRPRLVLLEGPAGIGKSAMLDRFLSDEVDLTVLRATGEQWEAFLAYGVVDQLMRMAGVSNSRLLVSRDRSLPTEEPVGVGARILEVLEDREQKAPVAVVIDDAHWADVDSLRALLFVVRRLVGERVLTVLAQRSEGVSRLPEGFHRMASGRTGATIRLSALPPGEIKSLADALGVRHLSARVARQLHTHTEGNPLYITTLLSEMPEERWRTWEPVLPAPGAFAMRVVSRLDACSPGARRLVEAAAVLGGTVSLSAAAVLADVREPVEALDEAVDLNLLQVQEDFAIRDVAFSHPLVQAAVYEQLGPARRVQLHSVAAGLVEDEASALRHRVMAVTPPDPELVADLDAFARREAAAGAWAGAAWALVEASRLSPDRAHREQRLLRAVDAMAGAGDLIQAEAFAREVVVFAPGPLRNAALGYLAVLRGEPAEAERLLHAAWERIDSTGDASLRAVVAQRLALHALGRLRGAEMVDWVHRSVELAAPGDPVRVEAQALWGLGLGWQGRLKDGLAVYDEVLDGLADDRTGPPLERVHMAQGWLRLVADDVVGARQVLAQAAPGALHAGLVRIAVWSYVWLARAGFALGDWDAAALDAQRAVSLLEESGHGWFRPLARFAAVTVPAARGEWAAAEEHARAAGARPGDYELMVVTGGLARAQVPAARGDHEGVLQALTPVAELTERQGVDEPGFWPWQDLYGDALVSVGRLDEADAFLTPHEEQASARGRGSMIAALARVRGRLEAARGTSRAAEAAFQRALAEVEPLGLPFQLALVELAYGQVLRRGGQRRAAAERLHAARERFAWLQARPYLERCERELAASGLAPAKRSSFDPSRLTAQELAVARLVAVGMSNRQVASELFVSIKTVQFHLTHIYAKLGVGSRAELAAQFRESEMGGRPGGEK